MTVRVRGPERADLWRFERDGGQFPNRVLNERSEPVPRNRSEVGAEMPWPALTISTGQFALGKTFSATLPIKSRVSPVRPCVPITIRSLPTSSAVSMIPSGANPLLSRVSTGCLRSGPSTRLRTILEGVAVDARVDLRRPRPIREDLERRDVEDDEPGSVISGKPARHLECGLRIDREVGGVEDDADLLGLARTLGGPESQDRTMGAAQDGDGHAPGQQPAQARAPVCPHDDQVATDFLGHSQDLLRGVSLPRLVLHVDGMVRSIDLAHFLHDRLVMGFVWCAGMELDCLAVRSRLGSSGTQFGSTTWRTKIRVLFSIATEQAARKASFEFSEKSAANRILRKGCIEVLLFVNRLGMEMSRR